MTLNSLKQILIAEKQTWKYQKKVADDVDAPLHPPSVLSCMFASDSLFAQVSDSSPSYSPSSAPNGEKTAKFGTATANVISCTSKLEFISKNVELESRENVVKKTKSSTKDN